MALITIEVSRNILKNHKKGRKLIYLYKKQYMLYAFSAGHRLLSKTGKQKRRFCLRKENF